MRYFPIFVDLDRQPVLVVGGGEQAAQKVRLLRKTTATIRIVADELCPELEALAGTGEIAHLAHEFHPDQVHGCRLVYAATEDLTADAGVAFAARRAGIPVNAVDRPQLCSFITPGIVDRDPIVVAIGSEGAAPVLVGRIRAMLEAALPTRLGAVASFAQGLRRRVARAFADGGRRRVFWERFFDGPASRHLLEGDARAAEAAIARDLVGLPPAIGSVALVGAGPGDPELLTLKAQRHLRDADVIVVDRLVDPRIVELARRDARRIFVGKTPGGPSTSQAEIDAILVREALAGHRVVRLKGGDPFVFGRAAEEIAALVEAGIPVEIVPGVTAALAAAADARLAVTERGRSRTLTILTGQTRDGPAEHDWAALVASGQTLAIYMGVRAAGSIAANLLAAGMAPETPVTIVENASLEHQKTVIGTLDRLAALIDMEGIVGPAVLFVGVRPLQAAGADSLEPAQRFLGRAA